MSWSQSREPTGSVEPAKNGAYGGTHRPSITHGSAKATATDSEVLTALVPRLHDVQSHPVAQVLSGSSPVLVGGAPITLPLYNRPAVRAILHRSPVHYAQLTPAKNGLTEATYRYWYTCRPPRALCSPRSTRRASSTETMGRAAIFTRGSIHRCIWSDQNLAGEFWDCVNLGRTNGR